MTRQQSEWNANAECAMMGLTVVISSEEQLRHIARYILYTIGDMLHLTKEEAELRADEAVNNALHKYNSSGAKVSHITTNCTAFGTCLTFVRDDEMSSLSDDCGVIAWVENLEYPDCSELGYVFFEEVSEGMFKRIA